MVLLVEDGTLMVNGAPGLRNSVKNTMYDDGTNGGDATAGDSIYTVQYKYQKNSTDVGMEFKFGINGEDNESGFGLNHIENIDINNPVRLHHNLVQSILIDIMLGILTKNSQEHYLLKS